MRMLSVSRLVLPTFAIRLLPPIQDALESNLNLQADFT